MAEEKIGPEDSTMDAMVKLSDGNPGAATALADVIDHGSGLLALLHLDSRGIYGPDIWVLYKDMCDHDVDCFVDKVLEDRITLQEIQEARYP